MAKPKTSWESLQEGARVYYTGDMANPSGEGVITLRRPIDPKWGYKQVDILLDDGRKLQAIGVEGFGSSAGSRFWLQTDWQADRDQRIAEFKAWAEKMKATA